MPPVRIQREELHKKYMDIALRLALKGRGKTSPNPMVGALVVKNGRMVGKGFHKKAGGPHAETFALDKAGKESEGATLYVTLEPCSHFGRTPPCIERILESGIKEVVVAAVDPNPLNNGKGIEILKDHGLRVITGICEDKAKKINEVFIKYITSKMPFICVKVGQSLDGKIATKTGDSKWITAEPARKYAHNLRSEFDAILVGLDTVMKDNPLLDRKPKTKDQRPIFKIIVDSSLAVSFNRRVFSLTSPDFVIVATTKKATRRRIELFCKKNIRVLVLPDKAGKVDLKALMRKLARMQITSVLVEGGGRIIGSLFDENLVDKVLFFTSPKIIGGEKAVSSVRGRGVAGLDRAIKLKNVRFRRLGEDFLIEGYLK